MDVVLMRSFEVSGVAYQLLNDKKHLIAKRALENDVADSFRWGLKTANGWKVYIGTEYQMCLGGVYERLSPEDAARKMLSADNRENRNKKGVNLQ